MKKFSFLWEYVQYWAEMEPEFPALHYENSTTSYGELDRLTEIMAQNLHQAGIGKGDTILTILPCSSEYIMMLLAADKLGAIIVPMDVKYRSDELKRFIGHVNPAAVVATPAGDGFDMAAELKNLQGVIKNFDKIQWIFTSPVDFGMPFQSLTEAPAKQAGGEALQQIKHSQTLEDGMLIVFTGGTTGVPKAALLSKQNVAAMAAAEAELIRKYLPGRIKTIAALPPSHVGGTVEMIGMALAGGYEIFVHDTWSPRQVLETTEKEKIPLMGGVPTMYSIMLLLPELENYDLSSLALAILSGEKVDTQLIDQIREKMCKDIIIGYGSTEAGAEVTFTEPDAKREQIADGYVGKPLPGVEIRIADTEGNPLPAGQKGEVQVKSPYTIKSYYKMPEEDEAGFTQDGFCKTGDLGILDEDGGLYIIGRLKHIIRVGSYTVTPSEVEEVIYQSGTVAMAAAIGVPDPVYGEVVWAVVSPLEGKDVTEEDIIQYCQNYLARFKVPKRVLVKQDLPVTRIGKVDRARVQDEVIEQL